MPLSWPSTNPVFTDVKNSENGMGVETVPMAPKKAANGGDPGTRILSPLMSSGVRTGVFAVVIARGDRYPM